MQIIFGWESTKIAQKKRKNSFCVYYLVHALSITHFEWKQNEKVSFLQKKIDEKFVWFWFLVWESDFFSLR